MEDATELRILIVEDHIRTAGELQIATGRIASTRIAADEDQVFFHLAGFNPHVVLLDITLQSQKKYPPRTAGIRILQKIRQLPSPAGDVPVIVVTARIEDEIEAECRRIGVSDFIRKPIKNPTLRRAIQAAAGIPARKSVFISYSLQDKDLCDRLKIHLAPLERQGLSIWLDVDEILPGSDWRARLDEGLRAAQVAVLLVSPDYLASEFVNDHELPYLLEAADRDDLTILWVPLSATNYETTELARFQAVRSPNHPLDALDRSSLNRALVEITKEIRKAAGETP